MAAANHQAEDSDDEDTITYQFEMAREEWRAWADTVPDGEALDERLRTLIRWNASSKPSAELSPHRALYLLSMDREAWCEWADVVPRSETLDSRLQTLIVQDTNSADVADTDVAQYDARTAATRIRIKAAGALSAIRDRDEPEDAIEKLSTIHDIADALESS